MPGCSPPRLPILPPAYEGLVVRERDSMNQSETWTVGDATELYDVERWGKGYFSVSSEGHLQVRSQRDIEHQLDLKKLVDQLTHRGLELPVLVRVNGLIKDRIRRLSEVFSTAIADNNYEGRYRCIYPIKVNQQHCVVSKVLEYGREFGFGLEAGSKPELLAVIAMGDRETPIICNGFKDDEFIEMAMWAQRLGRNVIPVVEKYTELQQIIRISAAVGVRPQIGMRIKVATLGSGRWKSSGGYRSKFGLTLSEILQALEYLESIGMSDCLQLLHFHLGSQITNIRNVKAAVNEAARVYAELCRRGAGLKYLDVGGGLGVDYDGSQTNFDSSMNYSLQEYANDVVFHIATVCKDAGVPCPDILTESGRAVSAFHAMLLFETLGVAEQGGHRPVPAEVKEEFEQPVQTLAMTYRELTRRNAVESFHDAQQAMEMSLNLFAGGYMPLEQRVMAEDLYFAVCRKLSSLTKEMDFIPEELQSLEQMLSDTFFCNLSIFQSIPDSWAISQLFPIMPIHRLDERPTRHAILADVTCDSDGKIDTFIDRRDVRKTVPVHEPNSKPYYIGAFLVGAYQEILGDLHNLFGDTHMVQVELQDDGSIKLEQILKGETVREVLEYVEYHPQDLSDQLQRDIDVAVSEGHIDDAQAGEIMSFYERVLNGYTYLTKPKHQMRSGLPDSAGGGISGSQQPADMPTR